MEIGEVGLAHVCSQYSEKEDIKTAPVPTLNCHPDPTQPPAPTLHIELCLKIIAFFCFLLKMMDHIKRPLSKLSLASILYPAMRGDKKCRHLVKVCVACRTIHRLCSFDTAVRLHCFGFDFEVTKG